MWLVSRLVTSINTSHGEIKDLKTQGLVGLLYVFADKQDAEEWANGSEVIELSFCNKQEA